MEMTDEEFKYLLRSVKDLYFNIKGYDIYPNLNTTFIIGCATDDIKKILRFLEYVEEKNQKKLEGV